MKLLSEKQLFTRVVKTKKATQTLHTTVQTIIIHGAGHALDHGRVTLFDKTRKVLGAYHQKAFDRVVSDTGIARFDTKSGTYKLNKKFRKDNLDNGNNGASYAEGLKETLPNWWEKPAGGDTDKKFDVAKRIKSIVNGMGKDGVDLVIDLKECEEALRVLQATIVKEAKVPAAA